MHSPHPAAPPCPEYLDSDPLELRVRPSSKISLSGQGGAENFADGLEETQNSGQRPVKLGTDHWSRPLQYLVQSQENVARLRLQIQERRNALRMKRLNVSESDRHFMDELYRWWAKGHREDATHLSKLYEQCQGARRDIGPAEDDYERLELQLGEVEYANTKDIRRLTTALQRNASDIALEEPEGSLLDSHISFESSTSVSHPNGNMEENVDLGVVEGRVLPGNLTSRALRQHEQDLSASNAIPSHRDGTIARPPMHRQHTPEVRYSSNDNHAAGNELSAIWNPMPAEYEYDLTHADDDVLRDRELDQDLSSLVICKPEVNSQSTLSDYLLDFQSPHNRVNRWLLHRLRTSYTEAMNLKQAVSETGVVDNHWPDQALELWEKDDAAISVMEPLPTEPTVGFDPVVPFLSMQPHVQSEPYSRIAPSPTPPDPQIRRTNRSSRTFKRPTDLPLFLWETVLQNPDFLDQI